MASIDDGFVPRRRPGAIFQWVEGRGVLVVPGREEVQVLNPVGARIWELIDGARDVQAIAGEIAREFHVDEATARSDTVGFLGTLRQAGMLDLA